jgi:hypothetical protein
MGVRSNKKSSKWDGFVQRSADQPNGATRMVNRTPKDFSRSPVEQFAKFLIVSGKEDPALLRRAGPPAADSFLHRIRDLPAMLHPAPRHGSEAEPDPYLESLVALAVSSAREAEDASRKAYAAIARARRGSFAFAGLATVGFLVGMVGITSGQFALRDWSAWSGEAASDGNKVQIASVAHDGNTVPTGSRVAAVQAPVLPPSGNASGGSPFRPTPGPAVMATASPDPSPSPVISPGVTAAPAPIGSDGTSRGRSLVTPGGSSTTGSTPGGPVSGGLGSSASPSKVALPSGVGPNVGGPNIVGSVAGGSPDKLASGRAAAPRIASVGGSAATTADPAPGAVADAAPVATASPTATGAAAPVNRGMPPANLGTRGQTPGSGEETINPPIPSPLPFANPPPVVLSMESPRGAPGVEAPGAANDHSPANQRITGPGSQRSTQSRPAHRRTYYSSVRYAAVRPASPFSWFVRNIHAIFR